MRRKVSPVMIDQLTVDEWGTFVGQVADVVFEPHDWNSRHFFDLIQVSIDVTWR